MIHRYIPILRWKIGERAALACIPPNGSEDIIPLIVLGDDLNGKEATKTKPAIAGPNFFAQEIFKIWGGRPFYLDASNIPPTSTSHHPLTASAQASQAAGANLIPATHLAAPPPYQTAVQSIANNNHVGAALRVKLQELGALPQWAATWSVPLNVMDLVVDCADTIGMVATLGISLTNVFQNLHGAGQWRTVTIAGTSMPENFTGYAAGLHTIPRAEIQVWQQLTHSNLSYRIDFGDYATVPIVPPPDGIRYGFPINVRYTLPAEFLICKGVVTRGPQGIDQSPQLIGHAQSIFGYGGRNPITCWGDSTVDNIAAGTDTPGALVKWVTIGVNRHIQLVRTLLP